jgi:LysM repeat protein
MGWQILNSADLPLGKRVLRLGARGKDVEKLQGLLGENGFYCGAVDGFYGYMTMEAVSMLQKTFKLRLDGIAGREVLGALRKVTRKTGRVIYTVKNGETLESISLKFGVAPAAWRTLPNQRTAVKDIYPGKKLLLYKKYLFSCEDRETVPQEGFAVTGRIRSGININSGGEIDWGEVEPDSRSYFLFSAQPEIWEEGLTSKKFQQKIAASLRPLRLKYGWDFRNAPLYLASHLEVFLKNLLRYRGESRYDLVLLPFLVTVKGCDIRLLQRLFRSAGPYARMILIEPCLEAESPATLQAAMVRLGKELPRFSRLGADREILWVDSSQGWLWSEDQRLQRIPFREIRVIRAMRSQPGEYAAELGLCTINYLKQGKPQTLIFRDLPSWRDLLRRLIRYNFSGVVIRDLHQLGNAEPELIAASFAVRSEG